MNKTIIFFIIIFLNSSQACEIVSAPYFLKFKNEVNDIIQNSNCDEETNKKFLALVSSSEGDIKTDFLKSDLRIVEKITPAIIVIKNITTLLKERCSLDSSYVLQVEESNTLSFTAANESDIKININDCPSLGKKMFQVLGPTKTAWVTINFQKTITAYKVKNHLMSGQGTKISEEMVEAIKIITDSPDKYLIDLKSLNFTKLTKSLQNNEPIKKSDILSYNLIELQFPSQVLLQKNGISIESYAQPMSSGKIGDVIRLRNLKTKKELAGKIIGPNKVEIVL
jgi:flagella basal body P-ring formation protein FlgA